MKWVGLGCCRAVTTGSGGTWRDSKAFERGVGGEYIRRSRRHSAGEVRLNIFRSPRVVLIVDGGARDDLLI